MTLTSLRSSGATGQPGCQVGPSRAAVTGSIDDSNAGQPSTVVGSGVGPPANGAVAGVVGTGGDGAAVAGDCGGWLPAPIVASLGVVSTSAAQLTVSVIRSATAAATAVRLRVAPINSRWGTCPVCARTSYRRIVDKNNAGRLLTVNVVAQIRPDAGSVGSTAIDKRPVAGRVAVGRLGVAGDTQRDTAHHGGPEQAVYAFAHEDVAHWEAELDRAIEPGTFGENFTTVGLEVSDALIGERWRVGSGDDAVVVEVASPRVPCMTFARWIGEQDRRWVRRFSDHGRVGAYLRVVTTGHVGAGDTIRVEHLPGHGVPVSALLHGLGRDQAEALQAAVDTGELRLSNEVGERVTRTLAG